MDRNQSDSKYPRTKRVKFFRLKFAEQYIYSNRKMQIRFTRYSSGAKSIRLTAMRADRVATLKCNCKTWGDGRSTRRTEAAVGRIGVHRTDAIRPGEILRIGFTKFHYGATCCRPTCSPPSPPLPSPPPLPPPALNSPDKAVIGCLRIYWGRSPPMEMRNIIAFQCFIIGRGIAARPSATFTSRHFKHELQTNRSCRKDKRLSNDYIISVDWKKKPLFFEVVL